MDLGIDKVKVFLMLEGGVEARAERDALRVVDERRRDPSGEAIREAMLALRGFRSVYGPTQFEADGTVLKPIAVKTIRGGSFVSVRVYGIDEIAGM